MLQALRTTLDDRGYLECPTPVRVLQPGVESTLFALPSGDRWLRTSPELALKKVVAAGLPRIYEIGPCFRDDEHGAWHRAEFTMLEWYRAGATLADLEADVIALVTRAADALGVTPPGPWRRCSVRDAFVHATGLDPWTTPPEILSPEDAGDPDGAFFRRWVADVEPTLSGAVFVHDWPPSQAAAARVVTRRAGAVTRRFEVFLDGIELANAFLELTDGSVQRARLAQTAQEQADAGVPVWPVDDAFLDAVDRMPPTAGIALGVDRLVALLAGWDGIGPGLVPAGD